jgi:hypothetical protein
MDKDLDEQTTLPTNQNFLQMPKQKNEQNNLTIT